METIDFEDEKEREGKGRGVKRGRKKREVEEGGGMMTGKARGREEAG